MKPVTDPVATVHVRSVDSNRTLEPGTTMGATAVFVLGRDEEVIPNWPAGGLHFSIILTFTEIGASRHEADAKVDFLDRAGVASYLREQAAFLIMAGPKPIAEAVITSVLWEPEA